MSNWIKPQICFLLAPAVGPSHTSTCSCYYDEQDHLKVQRLNIGTFSYLQTNITYTPCGQNIQTPASYTHNQQSRGQVPTFVWPCSAHGSKTYYHKVIKATTIKNAIFAAEIICYYKWHACKTELHII